MKTFIYCCFFLFASFAFGKDIKDCTLQELIDKADECMEMNDFPGREPLDLYNAAIEKMDDQDIPNYLEVFWKRCFAKLAALIEEYTPDEQKFWRIAQNVMEDCKEDLEFILAHCEKGTRFHQVVELDYRFFDCLTDATPSFDEKDERLDQLSDELLSRFATNKSARGDDLKRDVFENVQASEELKKEFFEFLEISSHEPDICLGKITDIVVKSFELKKWDDEDEGDELEFIYVIEYTDSKGKRKEETIYYD